MFKRILLVLLATFSANIFSMHPIYLNRFDYILYQPKATRSCQTEVGALGDFSVGVSGRNACKDKVNVLDIYSDTQDALSMIRGFDPNSDIGQLAMQLNNANDDHTRGNFDFCGKMHVQEIDIALRYYFPKCVYLSFWLPIINMSLQDLNYTDLTSKLTFQDYLVREYLTNNLVRNAQELGNLQIRNWAKGGLGDLAVEMGWKKDFPQNDRPILKNVQARLKWGATFPTGVKKDEDLFFSLPFGFDGAYGLFGGGTLEVSWWNCIYAGVDIRFLNLFGHIKNRRIKTDANQTEFLLLAKTPTYIDYGITQEYFLYLEARNFIKRVSFTFSYYFVSHHEDQLTVTNTCYNNTIANTAASLETWTIHNLFFMFDFNLKNKDYNGPRFALIYIQPINGKRSITPTYLGASFNWAF